MSKMIILIAVLAVAGQQASAWYFFAPSQQQVASNPVTAEVNFNNLDGVSGTIVFTQSSPKEATEVRYKLSGLKGNTQMYHVHVKPVPQFDVEKSRNNVAELEKICTQTGGHLNPLNITEKLPAKSAPFEKYELGDLSGKHGPLLPEQGSSKDDVYSGSYRDMFLPMSGPNSIVGRAVVIHKNNGKRWICANILASQSSSSSSPSTSPTRVN